MAYEEYLAKLYYDPGESGSYSGVAALLARARRDHPDISQEDVERFLSSQNAYTLHKPVRKNFVRNKTVVGSIDKQWQMDLADMIQLARWNKGYRFILTCIDCFSRYAWVEPVLSKSGPDMKQAIENILKRAKPRQPERLQTDKGLEFFNKHVKALLESRDIHLFASNSEFKAAMVERFNRTLKTKIWRYFTAHNTRVYIDILQQMVDAYNQSKHRMIGMRPVDVRKRDELRLWMRMHETHKKKAKKFAKIKPGEQVRMAKWKSVFDKGYMPNWTKEVFSLESKRDTKVRPILKVQDRAGETIQGRFYPEELQRVTSTDRDHFTIEKVLKWKTVGKRKEAFIKWSGWPDKFNSWLPEAQLARYKQDKT